MRGYGLRGARSQQSACRRPPMRALGPAISQELGRVTAHHRAPPDTCGVLTGHNNFALRRNPMRTAAFKLGRSRARAGPHQLRSSLKEQV
jgi:hypothetical protein